MYGYLNQQAGVNPVNGASLNPLLKIKNLRLRSNVNRVIIGNLNINSVTKIFDQLKEIVLKFLKYVDILVITETKLSICAIFGSWIFQTILP